MIAPQPPSDPQPQLAWLVDRAAIGDLLLDFARTIDDHDHAGYVANFSEHAVLELPFGTFRGRAAIAAMPTPADRGLLTHTSARTT